jgi:DNA-binding beta-propeller fold protein YncE
MKGTRVTAHGIAAAVTLTIGAAYPQAARAGVGEVWVTAQDAAKVHVVRGDRVAATVDLPTGTSPHFVRFSPSGRYLYAPGLGYGDVTVIRARDRRVVARLPIAPATPPAVNSNPKLPGGLGTHDAKPSPDGRVVLVSQWSNNSLYKLAANETAETWAVVQQAALPARPICIVFHPNGTKAYVGTAPSGIVVVDVATLQVLKALPTTGAWSCGWAQSKDGRTLYAQTNAAPGYAYRIDMTNDTIADLGLTLGAQHIHGLGLSADERTLYLASREDDTLRIVSLADKSVRTLSLDATPGVPDRPDTIVVKGETVWVSLRSSGKLARVRGARVDYLDLEPTCPATEPLCYAVHGIELRPDREPPVSRIAAPRSAARLRPVQFRTARGTASDELSPVASVELALRLRTTAGCRWWSDARKRLVSRSCARPLFFSALGRERWTYRLARALPAGRYQLRARATDSEGNREARFQPGRNTVSFALRAPRGPAPPVRLAG